MNPVYTINGQPVHNAKCGDLIGFELPGFREAWINVNQDGHVTFDGIMSLPMQPYVLKCPNDVGYFVTTAYEISPSGTRGVLIGQTDIMITDISGLQPGPVLPTQQTVQPSPAPTGTPPPMGQPLYTPLAPIDQGGGGPPIQFTQPTEEQPGVFAGLNLPTIALLGIGAFFLFRKKG